MSRLWLLASPALAAQCGGDYNAFIANFSREAAGKGISQGVLAQAFGGITFDPKVMEFDRRQRGTFKKSWEDYARTRVGPARVNRAKQMLKKHAALLGRVEQQFGVPKELIVSIWTMETDNGADMGKLPIVRTLATLAHDCRRTDLFQKELFAALQILQREDLPLKEMIGAYAGEIGQTQFLPSSYIKYGVDYDGNGHVDLRRSVPDVLASTANLLKTNGWQRGQPFNIGTPEFRGDARVEPLGDLPAHAALFLRAAAISSRTLGSGRKSARAANRLDVDAYRCVDAAARNRQNQLRPTSPLRPVVTRRVRMQTHDAGIGSGCGRQFLPTARASGPRTSPIIGHREFGRRMPTKPHKSATGFCPTGPAGAPLPNA